MTMPMPNTVQTIELPPPGYPMLTRMITNALFPDGQALDRKRFTAALAAQDVLTALRLLGDTAMAPVLDRQRFEAALTAQDAVTALRMLADAAGARAVEPEPLTWVLSRPHPLIPNMKVVRMFIDRGGVEVYSVSEDGKTGMRNLIPMGGVRLTEEAMPLDVFIDELVAAESDDEEEEEEEEETQPGSEPEAPGAPAPPPPNGVS